MVFPNSSLIQTDSHIKIQSYKFQISQIITVQTQSNIGQLINSCLCKRVKLIQLIVDFAHTVLYNQKEPLADTAGPRVLSMEKKNKENMQSQWPQKP